MPAKLCALVASGHGRWLVAARSRSGVWASTTGSHGNSIHRHAHALGLFAKRQRDVRRVLERILQQIMAVASGEGEPEFPPLDSKNKRGELVLTLRDPSELERRFILSGWQVVRRGNKLHCKTRRVRTQ